MAMRIPRDAYDIDLYRRVIRAELATWRLGDDITAHLISSDDDPDLEHGGVFRISLQIDRPFVPGRTLDGPILNGEALIPSNSG